MIGAIKNKKYKKFANSLVYAGNKIDDWLFKKTLKNGTEKQKKEIKKENLNNLLFRIVIFFRKNFFKNFSNRLFYFLKKNRYRSNYAN